MRSTHVHRWVRVVVMVESLAVRAKEGVKNKEVDKYIRAEFIEDGVLGLGSLFLLHSRD